MSKIAIITDVNAGLDYIGYDPQIPTLRSVINFGEEHLVDGIEIRADEFYERLKKVKSKEDIPSTSAPTLGDMMIMIEDHIKKGYTDIILFSISYKLSSIGQTFMTLKEEYADRINLYSVNTKTATYLQGYYALRAKEMVKEGKSVEEILEYSEYLTQNSHAYFVVDSLDYLVKNGRLSRFSGTLASWLAIKPILQLNEEGAIVTFDKVRTYFKAIERLKELVIGEIGDSQDVVIQVIQSGNIETCKEIVKDLKEYYGNRAEVGLQYITPAVGAHIGRDVVGIGYFVLDKFKK
ncbi:MAG: DegV family protein [Bacilli bacterium]|nr:DegV family protein [Bacilli bacterium]